MEQLLIDRLWVHSYQSYEESSKRDTKSVTPDLVKQIHSDTPNLLPASDFFQDASTLFMSFHPEATNGNRHSHDFFELFYVCKGNPVGIINDQEISLQEGNLCIMNPNAVHYFKKYSLSTDLVMNILFPKDLFQKSIFQILFNDPILNIFFIRYQLENNKQPSFLYLQHLDREIDLLIEMLLKEYLDKKQYSQVIIESLLILIFSIILRNNTEKASHSNSVLADIIDYIYLNYQTVNMDYLTAHFNYHPKYLSALIHKQTGHTFRALIANIKLQNAVNYLLYTEYSIEQIVDLIGYQDKSSFYSYFRKEYGTTPAEYRRLHR